MENIKYFNIAKQYRDQGLCVLPVPNINLTDTDEIKSKIKSPVFPWRDYQGRLPADTELYEWFVNDNYERFWFVCGRISGITVIDFDSCETYGLDSPIKVFTGKGSHQYFKYSSFPSQTNLDLKIEIRNNGCGVMAPPSIHWKSTPENIIHYRWDKDFDRKLLPELPPSWVTKYFSGIYSPKRRLTLGKIIVNGMRNCSMTSFLGELLHRCPEKDWEQIIFPFFFWYNENYVEPKLSADELETIFFSITERQKKNLNLKNLPPLN